MHKKLLGICLGLFLSCSLAACNTSKENSESNRGDIGTEQETQEDSSQESDNSDAQKDDESKEPILDADATDQELLDLVKDDIHVVTEKKFAKTVQNIKENPGNFTGQLYQLEGFYTKKEGTSYITDTLEGEAGESLPLQYLTEEPKEGARIRITGVLTESDAENGGAAGVTLDVVVAEPLEE